MSGLMSLIHTHPSGGQLWQGGRRDIWTAVAQGIAVVVLLADELQPDSLPGSPLILRGRLRDVGSMEACELAGTKATADSLAVTVAGLVSRKSKVLVSCSHGYNRSGLVSALTLVKLGLTPETAIAQVKKARHEYYALTNELFVRIVHGRA